METGVLAAPDSIYKPGMLIYWLLGTRGMSKMEHKKVTRRGKKNGACLPNLTLMGNKAKVRRGKRNVNISFIFEFVVFN